MFGGIIQKFKDKKMKADKINQQAESNVNKKYPQGLGSTSAKAGAIGKEISEINKRNSQTTMGPLKVTDTVTAKRDKFKKRMQNMIRGKVY